MRSAPVPETDAEPALFVHGLEGSSRNWTDLIDLLRTRLACEAMDLPGFGDSPPRPDGRYSIAALAQTVIALIQQQSKPVHLSATRWAARSASRSPPPGPTSSRPSRSSPRPCPTCVPGWTWCASPSIGPAAARPAADQAVPGRPAAGTPGGRRSSPPATATRRSTRRPGSPPRWPNSAGATRSSYAAAALMGSVRALSAEFLRKGRHSAWRDAARVTAPTLVIYGQPRPAGRPAGGGPGRACFADARVVVLPRTGHVAQMERPGRWRTRSASCWECPVASAG